MLATDRQGRARAARVLPVKSGKGIGMFQWFLLAGLLILPAAALYHQKELGKWGLAVMTTASLITYLMYASDKRRARRQAWRIPETQLHLFEILGGWPGAWLAQKRFRHKCSKLSYQFFFWSIVVCHQAIAYDSLHDWHYLSTITQLGQR